MTPASDEEFASLPGEMGAPDGEGRMASAARRLAVRFDEAVWREAVRGLSRELMQTRRALASY